MDEDAELFIRDNYTETKDFCKQFLTLVVGVLVFSLTFSEKVIGFQQASMFARLSLAIAWASMLIAIISCGIGVTFMALAGGQAVYGGSDYQKLASRSYKMIVVAGGSFVAALVLLMVAASASIVSPNDRMPRPCRVPRKSRPAAPRPRPVANSTST